MKPIEFMNIKGEWLWRGLISIISAYMLWTVTQAYGEQRRFNDAIHSRVSALELVSARTEGNRFTSADWIIAKGSLDSVDVGLDKRVTRNEDALSSINGFLEKINTKLDNLQ